MSSLGESDVLIGNRIVGKTRVLNIHAEPAIYPRLGIGLGCLLMDVTGEGVTQPITDYELKDVFGELRISEYTDTVGTVIWAEAHRNIKSLPHASEHQLKLACDLDPWRLEKIETHRNGKAPTFWLEIWPTVVTDGKFLDAKIKPIRMNIPREQWLEFLSKVRHNCFEVIEVWFEPSERDVFQRALEHTKAARRRIDSGEYEEAIAGCRKAIEALVSLAVEGEESLRFVLERGTDEKRAQHYAGIVSKIKELAALAHHDLRNPVRFLRTEAQFIVRTTENLIALIGALPRIKRD